MAKHQVQLLLDSGVFSAWNRGEELSLKDYIAYVKDYKAYLWAYVGMDKIPGVFGRRRTQKEVDDSAKIGYDNLQTMKGHGLNPIPVFHQGEKLEWLERMVKDGEPYIGISTAKDLPLSEHVKWLDQMYTMLTDSKGWPIIKTHGFGITRPGLVFRYPFYSCDSTTWTLTPGFGQIWCPPSIDGKFSYDRSPMQVVLSDVERKASSNANRYENLGKETQSHVLKFLDECGVLLKYARYHPDSRRKIMLHYFVEFHKHRSLVPFRERRGFFNTRTLSSPKNRPKWDRPNIMLATNLSRAWSILMNDQGANQRLLSYYELMGRPDDDLPKYVTDGTIGAHKKQNILPNWRASYTSSRRLKTLERWEQMDDIQE